MLKTIYKYLTKIALAVTCFQLKRKSGVGKEFQRILDTKNITAAFHGKFLLYIPVHVHVNVAEDKYYFTYNGILVGTGNLDGLDPVTIIRKDCIEYGILYNYVAAYAVSDSITRNKILDDKDMFEGLIIELAQLAQLKKKETV